MKAFIIAIATFMFLLGLSAHAEEDSCDYKYYRLIKKVKSLSNSEMSQEDRDKWISKLGDAYQLCKEGKNKEAAEIMAELNKDRAHDLVFNPAAGN